MLRKLKFNKAAVVSILAVSGLLISGFVAPAFGASAQPYKGTTLTLETYSSVPEFDYYKTLMPAFTQETGIKVNFLQLPVDTIDQKIPLQLKAKDAGLDVFFTGSEKISAFVGSGGVPDLNPYIKNTKYTPTSYNFKDVAPAVEAACQSGGKTYCIATHTGGALLYYNTKMFKEAGITTLPKTPEELLADAKKLTTKDHAGFCVRGDKSQGLYDAFQIWNWFVPYNNPITGTYFDKNWNFLIGSEPQASKFATYYRDLLQNTAPKGIATYLVTNCLQDFQQGRVAMWHDDSGSIPDVLDPDKSKVSSDTAFWSMPCPAINANNCALVQPFGIWMNNASTKKLAAWQLIQYLTTAKTQLGAAMAKKVLTPSRLSVLSDPAAKAVLPKTFPEALTYILGHPDTALLPFIAEGVPLIKPIADGLSDLITTDTPVAQIMATMKAGADNIMKQAGYPKPFPKG